MKVLFIIPDGVGIRNYLYSDVITHLKDKAEIVFWSTLPKGAFAEVVALHQINIEIEPLTIPIEGIYTRLYREAASYARLIYNSKAVRNETIMTNWTKKGKSFKLRILYNFAERLGSAIAKSYEKILKIEEKSERGWSRTVVEGYKEQLRKVKPSTIFITHQRVAGLMPICIAAKELGIKVITVVYSWDNLPKARMAVRADKYIVWSDWMREEMETYYPHVSKSQVVVCGTPQFDFYYQKARVISRRQFANQHNLDENKKWICFSGSDKLTCPGDPDYLNDVIEAIKKMSLSEQPEIVFRRSPADFSERYNEVINKNRGLIKVIDPIWYSQGSNWTAFFSKIADVDMLVNLASHCHLVINAGSTMAHDFAIYDKPCLYISYDKPYIKDWSVNIFYKFQHFRTMMGLDAVGFVKNVDEWPDKIRQALSDSQSVGRDRKLWLQRIIQHPIENSSKLVADAILK